MPDAKMHTSRTKSSLWLLLLLCTAGPVMAQRPFDIGSASIVFPGPPAARQFKKEIALSQIKLPFDWLENSVQAPLFQFHTVYGLPKNFSVDGRFSTLFVSNEIRLGPRWGQRFNRFSFNIGYDIGYAFGFLNLFGFDSSVSSVANYPNFSMGYKTSDIAFAIKGELNMVTTFSSRQGEIEVSSDRNFFNGFTAGIYVEQRLWRDHVFILGFKNTVAKYHFMAWPAFSTFNRFYNIPEVYLGLIVGR